MNQTNTRRMAVALRQRGGDKADELLELLKHYSWNISVRIFKQRRKRGSHRKPYLWKYWRKRR